MNVIWVLRKDPFPPIIIVISVMCAISVRHDIQVMSPIPLLLNTLSYKSYASNVCNSRYEDHPFSFCRCSKCFCVICVLFRLYTLWAPYLSSSILCAGCCACYACYACFAHCETRAPFPLSSLFLVFCILYILSKIYTLWAHTLFF